MHVTKISENSISITGCVISYPHLHEPRAVQPGQPAKYSGTIILPKTLDQADWDILNGMVAQLTQAKFPQGAPANFRAPWHNAGEKVPEYEGHISLNCSAASDKPPQVVTENPQVLAQPGEVYAGCGINVFLGGYAYQNMGNAGVNFGLNAVQIADRTLPAIDGRKQAKDVFGQVAVQAPAVAPGAPAAGMPAPVAPTPHQPSPAPAPAAPVAAVAAPVAPGAPEAPAAAPVAPGAPVGPGPTIQ